MVDMLFRIVFVVAFFFGVGMLYLNYRVEYLKKENTTLQSEKNGLKDKIKGYEDAIQKYNDAQERAGKTIEKVRTIVRTVKSDCDCWHTPVDDRVRNEIRKRRNRK